jgi:hypothetical protein
MRHFQLPNGRSIELEDGDFRSLVHSNREEVMRMLGVKRTRPKLVVEINEGGGSRVRLEGSQEQSRQDRLDAALDEVIDEDDQL